ncbi:MAG: hypothetical protein JXB36_06675 [Gammaproteobacteria bacterium]|nr:hypothetical protein [Gammaproteobacteria bacterium]
MSTYLSAALAALAAAIFCAPAAAHHSFAAEFDADQPIELTGVVTKVEWMNPHTFFYIDVQNEDGEYEVWALELGSPNGLARRGWKRDSLNIGDVVTVSGARARDGSLKGNARSVVLASGKRLFNGTNEDGQ